MKVSEKRPHGNVSRREAFALELAQLHQLRRFARLCVLAPIAALVWALAIPRAESALPTSSGWYAMPNTNLASTCPANHYGGTTYNFADMCGAVTAAWSSGVMDTLRNRLIVWGGGHNDYAGNEVYAVNLNDQTIQRLTNPS